MVNGHPEYIDKALEQMRFQGGPCLSDPGDPKGTPIVSDHDHERGPKELTLKHNKDMGPPGLPHATKCAQSNSIVSERRCGYLHCRSTHRPRPPPPPLPYRATMHYTQGD